jgi:hypothetical protein
LTLFWWCLRMVLASTHPIVLDVIFYPCRTIHFGTYWLGRLAKIRFWHWNLGSCADADCFIIYQGSISSFLLKLGKQQVYRVSVYSMLMKLWVLEFNLRSLSVDLIGMANCFCFIFHLWLNFRRLCKAVGIPLIFILKLLIASGLTTIPMLVGVLVPFIWLKYDSKHLQCNQGENRSRATNHIEIPIDFLLQSTPWIAGETS